MRNRQLLKLFSGSAKILPMLLIIGFYSCSSAENTNNLRERVSLNDNWRFFKYESAAEADHLIYDVRPEEDGSYIDSKDADSRPDVAIDLVSSDEVLKPWILPSGNYFIQDPDKRFKRPDGNPGADFPFVQNGFDDSLWETVSLPHDWAIEGPFQEGMDSEVGGGMGRLPINGVAWYRRTLNMTSSDRKKLIFLDVDGAMSYAMVWLNGKLVGGWPYGYNSFRLDLTPYINFGEENQLAIRVDNPNNSARWYSGAGIYRNIWLVKTNVVHVSQWGSTVTTTQVSEESAKVNLEISVDNNSEQDVELEVETEIFELDAEGNRASTLVAGFGVIKASVAANSTASLSASAKIENPRLWGPLPTQQPNMYVAVSTVFQNNKPVDRYESRFGIRSLEFNPDAGLLVNGELIKFRGVNNHHDLGALGAAFHVRAAERQLEILQEMGCNAIRMAHNPPAPELLDLCDRMGILVVDEVFDVWERKKTPHDFHLIFPEWYEQDLRSMIRRDKNHPSIIMWSYGNEVGEQYTDEAGAKISRRLKAISKDEDPSRLTTASMNWAKPDFPFAEVLDIISLNYQGEGIRQTPEFEGTDRIRTKPQYPAFHSQFPDKLVLGSETASAASSRGVYLFPVSKENSSSIRDGRGGDSRISQVSSYELYAVDFGSSADKVFASLEKHPFVAGEFVWNGFDYLGEPTPYYDARSSYTGIIDLAGFPKDRYYLYQSHWRPELPMVHILPHWNWSGREGEITPVHVFTSGDEAELFLNGKSLGRKKKGQYEYRLRWDDVKYVPGELKVMAYNEGEKWAEKTVNTTGEAAKLVAEADQLDLASDAEDLSFITVKVCDEEGNIHPVANNMIEFEIEGPGQIVATDNGDPACLTPFPSPKRMAFNGLVLAIVKANRGETGTVTLKATSEGLLGTEIQIAVK